MTGDDGMHFRRSLPCWASNRRSANLGWRFTVDIRGFTVDIVATASAFTWDTGDGTVLQTTDPGAPYPDHTISHDYRSGTYTASLTTTWSGTFSVDGGATADVPGTTTTAGPPATFSVLQASPVLTNPFD